MTSKIVVNNIDADAGVSTVTFGSKVSATEFIGNVTGNLTGNVTGNLTGNVNSTGVTTVTTLNVGTGASISSPASNVLTLGTNNTERVRIDSGGRIITGNYSTALDATAGSIIVNGDTSGGRIAQRGSSTSADASLGELFGFWDTNKVAGIIFSSGSDTTNKDDGTIKFYTSSAGPSVTERLRIDSSGRVTMPYQPLAVVGKTTGTSSTGTIVFEKVWHNVGSHYDNSTGVFTCPVAGYYYTHIMVMSNASDTTMDINLHLNGSVTNQLVPYQAGTGGAYNQVSGSTIIYCSANDNLRYNLNSGSIYGGGASAGRHSSVIFHLVG